MVRLNKNGGPKNPEKVDRLCALFTVTRTQTHTQMHSHTLKCLRSRRLVELKQNEAECKSEDILPPTDLLWKQPEEIHKEP